MPSSSAKQHRFMQAVAHSPSFAKKAGVSQSVGKDFSSADKGSDMKKGKRFNGEDGESGVEYHDYDPDKSYSGRFTDDETGELAENTPRRSTAKAAPATPSRTASASAPARSSATSTASVAPFKANSDPNRRTFRPIRDNASADIARKDRNTSGIEDYIPPKQQATVPANDPLEVFSKAAIARRAKELQDAYAALDKEAGKTSRTFKKGGDVMESKKMMGKEVAFMKKKGAPASMIKHEKAEMGMKKSGMPMKDGKPAFMKKMMGGGMAYAKGGGIESRGKTKGTIIRMAAGGSVSSRADGIAMRGKTRGKMV